MAVNMGNPSQWSFRVRGSHNIGIHVYPQIMSLTPSAQKWPHLVQNSTRRVPLGFKNYSTFPKSIVAVQGQISGRTLDYSKFVIFALFSVQKQIIREKSECTSLIFCGLFWLI